MYQTVTLVVPTAFEPDQQPESLDDLLEVLGSGDVLFFAIEDGVTSGALSAGADPDSWP